MIKLHSLCIGLQTFVISDKEEKTEEINEYLFKCWNVRAWMSESSVAEEMNTSIMTQDVN